MLRNGRERKKEMKKAKRHKDVETVTRIGAQVLPENRNTRGTEREQFAKALEYLKAMVVEGKAHIKIAYGIASAMKADPVIAQVAPTFWGTTIHAHLDRAQLLAYKLFDTQGNAMTVESLLDITEKQEGMFQYAAPDEVREIVKTAREQIEELADPLKPVRAKRNRILAHSDATIVRDPVALEKEVKVTWAGLNRIFTAAGEILNELSRVLNDVTSILEVIGAADYEMVVQLVIDAKHAQVDQYEKDFGEPCPFPRPVSRRTKLVEGSEREKKR
jgi:hypothetical protein